MARPFAVFDIDGTLIRWQLYHALADELARQGHLDQSEFQKVRQARMSWKKRRGESSFDNYEQALVDLITKTITNIRPEDVARAADSVMAEYKDQVYTYTRDLIQDLKAKNYLLFTLSASQSQIVGRLAEYYGFDEWGGSTYEVTKGHFTGKMDVMRSNRKPEYLKELVAKHNATWQGSIAVGDSDGDIAMLQTVEQPTAFNPSKKLFEYAKKHGWQIVLERKNVVYKLEAKNGTYKLAA